MLSTGTQRLPAEFPWHVRPFDILSQPGTPADDRTLAFRRIDGNPASNVIYFLPWFTPFWFARRAGFAPLDFLAAYEMPPAIVSSEPAFCVQAMRGLVQDAERLLQKRKIKPEDAVIVGLSVGTYPATYLANRIGARLCSVASADRADLAIWESPATRVVKRRALKKGFRLAHYSEFLQGSHPAQNLQGSLPIASSWSGSAIPTFHPTATRDCFRPLQSTYGGPGDQARHRPFKTLTASGRYQRAMLGIEAVRRKIWRMPAWPFRGAGGESTASP